NPIPAPRTKTSGPLFKGTLVFVQLIFQEPNRPAASVSLADVQTAVSYAALAVQPIHRYAWQFGQNSVGVWPNVISLNASVSGTAFKTAQFEGWVEQAANIARDEKVENPCIVILHNRDLPNTPQFTGNRNSFH